MIDTAKVKEKIIEILKTRGPCLPIQISKETNVNSLFVSAFISELLNEKKIKKSELKVGGSYLFYLEGQEKDLEKFDKFMHPKEREAYYLLKDKKILKDSEQEPAIRVALKAIKDFASQFKKDEEIYWRYAFITNEEIEDILEPKKQEEKEEKQRPIEKEIKQTEEEKPIEKTIKKEEKTKTDKPKREKIEKPIIKTETTKSEFENPLVIKPLEKTKKEKEKSWFVLKVIDSLKKKDMKLIQEIDHKAKEYTCISQMDSDLGPINFYTIAKDKKTISESDVIKILSDSQKIPLPALVIYTGELSKKAKEFQEKYFSVLKTKKII
jgi:hypothetical protein